jgi:hypothetical protein
MCARSKMHAFNYMDPPEWYPTHTVQYLDARLKSASSSFKIGVGKFANSTVPLELYPSQGATGASCCWAMQLKLLSFLKEIVIITQS